MPALLTSMSSRPYRSTASPTAFRPSGGTRPSPPPPRRPPRPTRRGAAPRARPRRGRGRPLAPGPPGGRRGPVGVHVRQADPRALAGEPSGDDLPDPAPRPRHHRDPAVEPAHRPPFGRCFQLSALSGQLLG